MPVVDNVIEPVPPKTVLPEPTPIKAEPTLFRGIAVDTRYIPQSNLLTHIAGSAWSVNYFSQVLTEDSELVGNSTSTAAPYQPYKLILNFELKVTNALQTSQNPEDNSMNLVGSANVYPFVIPNRDDIFIADIGDGREALFTVTRSTRLSVYKEAVHSIEYELVNYLTEQSKESYLRKVVETLYFHRDFLAYGQNPLLHKQSHEMVLDLRREYDRIYEDYMRSYWSDYYKVFLVPAQPYATYDHFLMKAMRFILELNDDPRVQELKLRDVQDDPAMECVQIYSALVSKNINLLPLCCQRVGLVTTGSFSYLPVYYGIRYSGMPFIVYPQDPTVMVDSSLYRTNKPLSGHLIDAPFDPRKASLVSPMWVQPLVAPNVPELPSDPAVEVSEYVFSPNFYNQEGILSPLEDQVTAYLKGQPLNATTLSNLCAVRKNWTQLQRFYWMPVLMFLIQAHLNIFAS